MVIQSGRRLRPRSWCVRLVGGGCKRSAARSRVSAPDGQAGTVNANSRIEPVDRGTLDTDTAAHELVGRLGDVTARIRARMDRLGELDFVSQDVLVEVVRELEKQLWMLRAALPAADS